MNRQPYKFSFTSLTAAVYDSIAIAELYVEFDSWDKVENYVHTENLLQARTISSRGRMFREIRSRLRTLNSEELSLLARGKELEQKQLIWLAICNRYRPIHDFTIEVLNEHYLKAKQQILPEAFERFFLQKTEWHPDLEKLSPATISKTKHNLFKMLKECGLLSSGGENMIIKQELSSALKAAMKSDNEKMALYPGLQK